MTSTAATQAGSLRELTEAECWQHLAEHTVGRLAYTDGGGVVILPLNYRAQDDRIWLRTAPYDHVATHAVGQVAAFEIDHIDEHRHTGHSVLVRGTVEHATREPGQPDPTPWPDGVRSMLLCLTANEITGRALRQGSVKPTPGHGPGTIQRRGDEATDEHVHPDGRRAAQRRLDRSHSRGGRR